MPAQDNIKKRWMWDKKRTKRCFLALEDGTVFRGYCAGAQKDSIGEVVFNTGMTGYQEILTDPSYSGQIVVMTYPEIGNYGINAADAESRACFVNGFIVNQMNSPSNWRCEQPLEDYLIKNNITALAGIDTRALTSKLRDQGTLKGYLSMEGSVSEDQAVAEARRWHGLDGQDYARRVSCERQYAFEDETVMSTLWGMEEKLPPPDMHVVVYDFGIKWNIVRMMRMSGIRSTVVPAQTPAQDVLAMKCDGVFFSNGPADPAAVVYAIDNARALMGRIPLMGICLGHQILSLAAGAKTYRLKFGHHGCNHPVKDLTTGIVEITSQNHNFAVDEAGIGSLPLEITHINLNDRTVEGVRHRSEPMLSLQYHPEASPGPHDSAYLFQRFKDLIMNKL